MTEESQSLQLNSESDTKEQLYLLYLEIKSEITKKNIEIEQDQFDDLVKTTKLSTLINYIKELIYTLINLKCPNPTPIISNENKEVAILQLENHIKKLEYDIRYYIQREFQHKIQRDALEMKLNAYMEMENEFEELKEKVKYEGGKFLNNDRKDNEIIILRQENCILKKELAKNDENSNTYKITIEKEQKVIQELNNQISNLHKKINQLEEFSIKDNKPNTNNSSINININNNGSSESKWIIKQENEEHNLSSNINPNYTMHKKNYTKNSFQKNYSKYPCNLHMGNNIIGSQGQNSSSGFSNFNIKNHRSHNKVGSTIDNNNKFAATYNKILNNLSVNKGNRAPVQKDKMKKNGSSVSMCEEYEKSVLENKYLSNKGRYKSNGKNSEYNKIMGLIPNSKFPLTSKHQSNKNSNNNLQPKKYLQREKSAVNHSALNIKRNPKN